MKERNIIQVIAEEAGLQTRSYSGRAMYGAQCLAIEADDLGQVIRALAVGSAHTAAQQAEIALDLDDPSINVLDEIEHALRDVRWDSMGLGIVVYFPGTKFVDVDDTDEEG